MSELHTIEAFVVDRVKEVRLPKEIPGCPLSADARRLILAEVPIIVTDPAAKEDALPFTPPRIVAGYDSSAYRLVQTSSAHQRSFELHGPGLDIPWQDTYGNQYSSINLKGTNLSRPGIMEHPTAVDQYVAWGLQESKIIERVLRASEVMCARGISTEKIIGLAEPKAYPYPLIDDKTPAYTFVPLAIYRHRIVEEYWRGLPEDEQSIDRLVDLTSKFREMTYYISMRAVDTPYRIGDINRDEEARKQLFAHVNSYYLKYGQEPYDATLHDDWIRFLRQQISPNLGKNLAAMHPDLAHDYLHGFNITALGGIVDTDSVHGEPLALGDKPVTAEDRARDLLTAADSLLSIATGNLLLSLPPKPEDVTIVGDFIKSYMIQTMIKSSDRETALSMLAELVEACEVIVASASWNSSMVEGVAERYLSPTIRMNFIGCFTIGNSQAFSSFSDILSNEITVFGSREEVLLSGREYLTRSLADYAGDLADEYVNELQDSEYDVAADFVAGCGGSEVREAMNQKFESILHAAFRPQWAEVAEKIIPGLIDQKIEHAVYKSHMVFYKKQISEIATKVIDKLLPEFIDQIRNDTRIERPDSLLTDYDSRPWAGVAEKRFWLSTEDVPEDVMFDLLDKTDIESKFVTFPKEYQRGQCEFSIADGSRLREIITDGLVESCSYADDNLKMDITIENGNDGPPTYALVVLEFPNGSIKLEIYLKKLIRELIDHKIAVGTPLYQQDTLF